MGDESWPPIMMLMSFLQDISNKTKELLTNLKSLATTEEDGRQYITLESLKERNMPPATENFLFSLAACEGLVKLWWIESNNTSGKLDTCYM